MSSRQTAKSFRPNDTQLVVLSAAHARDDGSALPWPRSLKTGTQAFDRSIKSLMTRGLLEAIATTDSATVWRRDEEGRGTGLRITEAGRTLIDGADTAAAETEASTGDANASSSGSMRRARVNGATDSLKKQSTKADKVLTLMRRAGGATIVELSEATGWQAHSVRGFLSGTVKKRMGLTVTSEKDDKGVRRYRIDSTPET